jgi:hypothetical protein
VRFLDAVVTLSRKKAYFAALPGHMACPSPVLTIPREAFSMSAGRTIGAAIGLVLFILFFATLASRLANPVSAAELKPAATLVP